MGCYKSKAVSVDIFQNSDICQDLSKNILRDSSKDIRQIPGSSYFIADFLVAEPGLFMSSKYEVPDDTKSALLYSFEGYLLKVLTIPEEFRPNDRHRCSIFFGAHMDPDAKLAKSCRYELRNEHYIVFYDRNNNALSYLNFDIKSSMVNGHSDWIFDIRNNIMKMPLRKYGLILDISDIVNVVKLSLPPCKCVDCILMGK